MYNLKEVYTYKEHIVDVVTCDGKQQSITVKANDRNLGKNIMETLESIFQYDKELPRVVAIN